MAAGLQIKLQDDVLGFFVSANLGGARNRFGKAFEPIENSRHAKSDNNE